MDTILLDRAAAALPPGGLLFVSGPPPLLAEAGAQEAPVRQLSPSERAEMRQQLRQQQAESQRYRP